MQVTAAKALAWRDVVGSVDVELAFIPHRLCTLEGLAMWYGMMIFRVDYYI